MIRNLFKKSNAKRCGYGRPCSLAAVNFYDLKPAPDFISLGVKAFQQMLHHTCGPACAMSLLHWYGKITDKELTHELERKIEDEMGTKHNSPPPTGTTPEGMIRWFENNGFSVTAGENGTLDMLINNLRNGIPTIVEWADWGGHWAIVTGILFAKDALGEDYNTLFLADPAAHYTCPNNPDGIMSYNACRFSEMWFDPMRVKADVMTKGIYLTVKPK